MASKTPINPKRNRQAIPSRHLVGRLGKGVGPEELISLDDVANAMGQGNNAVANGGSGIKKLHAFLCWAAAGLFNVDQYFTLPGPPHKTRFPQFSGILESIATATFVGTNTTHFYLTDDVAQFLSLGTRLICTVTFAAGSHSGSFVYNGVTTVTAGQQLYLVCDHVADPTLAEVQINFCGDNVS